MVELAFQNGVLIAVVLFEHEESDVEPLSYPAFRAGQRCFHCSVGNSSVTHGALTSQTHFSFEVFNNLDRFFNLLTAFQDFLFHVDRFVNLPTGFFFFRVLLKEGFERRTTNLAIHIAGVLPFRTVYTAA